MVEAAGVEPASGELDDQASTGLVIWESFAADKPDDNRVRRLARFDLA